MSDRSTQADGADAGVATGWEGNGPVAADEDRWLALAVVLVGAFVILLGTTIVNVAVPVIQRELGASNAQIQWVVGGYALAYGLLLIPAGRLGDRYGYKRVFLVGMAGFTAVSALCGTAGGPWTLVGWQVALGAMAGVMNPQILAVIQVAFPPEERGRAYGVYGAVSGVAVALGPLLGGLLIQWDIAGLSWRPIFLVNVPVGLLALIVAVKVLKEARGRGGALDVVGILLVSTTVLLVTFPSYRAARRDGRYGRSRVWPWRHRRPWASSRGSYGESATAASRSWTCGCSETAPSPPVRPLASATSPGSSGSSSPSRYTCRSASAARRSRPA